MTDRELLELAAKAADIAIEYRAASRSNIGSSLTKFVVTAWHGPFLGGTDVSWNPLTDDGDAFRLANALHLTVYHAELAVVVKHKQYSWEWMGEGVNEDTGDRNASARRIITRAAAEIGRSMP